MKLTPRDIQVLDVLLTGASNKEIAADLNIAVRTVKHHMRILFLRLGIEEGHKRTKLALAYRAIKGEAAPTELSLARDLSPKEKEAFRLVALGRSNREAADEMHIGEQGFKNLVHGVFDKFGVWNRTELALKFTESTYVA